MKVNIFIKTFLMLIITFSIVFLLSIYLAYTRFSPMYIEENIEAVKTAINSSATTIEGGTPLVDTDLYTLAQSETSFIRYKDDAIIEELGPDFIDESEIFDFVINIYDSESAIVDDNLTYYIDITDDVYSINYIYEFGYGDYLIVSTKIQSLQNIDRVLTNLNITQSLFLLGAIILISILISINISKPIKKINKYARDISNLKFDTQLQLKRKDEFRELVSSLNEMTFNLRKSYTELNEANEKLSDDINFEKIEEEKKKNLIMTINHELKTPLAVMRGMIEGMIDSVGRYKDRDKYLLELLTQIDYIENIAKDLTYSLKLEDKAKLNDICNTSIIEENLKSLEKLASLKEIKINRKLIKKDIIMNDELLLILVANLVKNAITYTTSNSIIITTEVIKDDLILTVKNKGEIPHEDIDKLFNSFFRSSNSNIEKDGTGLGLFIVKQICDIYNYSYKIFNDNGFVTAKINLKIKN